MDKVCIIVRDGWGYNEKTEGNAVAAANTPNVDAFKEKYPWVLINTSGEAVGLPDGFQGSSEVGHLNMGAGRVVVQELKRIDDGFQDGSIFENEKWKDLMKQWKEKKSKLHLFGLLQDEGVHAHQDHLFKIMKRARQENPDGAIVVHPFLDGRDTPPHSTLEYIAQLKDVMNEIGNVSIGTAMGRFYAMDRSQNWKLTDQAYHCIVSGEGRKVDNLEEAIKESYKNDKTPDGEEMFDEYIPPMVVGNYEGVKDGDVVFHTNYRQDRAIQLTKAFVEPDYLGNLKVKPDVKYLGFTQYYDELEQYLMGAMSSGGSMDKLLGEVLADAGKTQLRLSETQKFRHVTSFFNGKKTTPYKNEDQVEVKSEIDPSSYARYPQMEAYTITDKLKEILDEKDYDFIVMNYPNGDMVGHTGNFEAAKKAIEVVDECLGKTVPYLQEKGYGVFITADHGNSEQMKDYNSGLTKTSHTTFPVELIYVANDADQHELVDGGKLADLATSTLYLMGIDIPKEMTADVIIKKK